MIFIAAVPEKRPDRAELNLLANAPVLANASVAANASVSAKCSTPY
jgi:hypothetical protein